MCILEIVATWVRELCWPFTLIDLGGYIRAINNKKQYHCLSKQQHFCSK